MFRKRNFTEDTAHSEQSTSYSTTLQCNQSKTSKTTSPLDDSLVFEHLFKKYQNHKHLKNEICSLRLQLESFQKSETERQKTDSSIKCRPFIAQEFLENFAMDTQNTDSQISADACVTRLLEIFKQNPCEKTTVTASLLSEEQRVRLSMVKTVLRNIKLQHSELWLQVIGHLIQEDLPLEVIWQLHIDDILPLNTFFGSILETSRQCSQLTAQLLSLSVSKVHNQNICQQILSAFYSHLVIMAFPEKSEDRTLKKFCIEILDGITKGFLDSHLTAEYVFLHTDLSQSDTIVPRDCFKKFCTHNISVIMSHRPTMKVSEALKRQQEWKSAKIPVNLKSVFKQLLVPFECSEVLGMLHRILEKQEVNWQYLLSFLAVYLVCFQQASVAIQDHISALLSKSLENGDIENTIVAFLLVRQSCYEGLHVFPAYHVWFQDLFGNSNKTPASSKKSFTFLIKFLTDLVPFEPAEILKVHVLRPPFAPVKCRDILTDYICLAKTRLSDLKVPLEEANAAIYESSLHQLIAPVQANPGIQDVEKALAVFESTGRLPSTVMEASIFRKPYFVGKFLPALLQPRHLPDVADTRMKFIDALKKNGKIPTAVYAKYEEACKRETKLLLEGVFEAEVEDEMDDLLLEPREQLAMRLKQFSEIVVAQESGKKVSEIVSIISEKLDNVLQSCSLIDEKSAEKNINGQCMISVFQPRLNPALVQVLDQVLNCVCKTLYAAHDISHQGWLKQIIKMLSQNSVLHSTLYTRLLLLCKDLSLSEYHIEALAAFIFHVSLHQELFPPICVQGNNSENTQEKQFLNIVLDCLSFSTEPEMLHTHKFLTYYLKSALFHLDNIEDNHSLTDILPRKLFVLFTLLSWRLNQDLLPTQSVRHTLMNGFNMEQVGCSSVNKALFTSEKFQSFFKLNKPTLNEWLDFELCIDLTHDCLTPMPRRNYHLELIGYLQSSLDEGDCNDADQRLKACCTLLLKKVITFFSKEKKFSERCKRCGQHPLSELRSRRSQESADCLLMVLAKLVQSLPQARLNSDKNEEIADEPWLLQQVSNIMTSPVTVAPLAVLRVILSLPAYLIFTDTPWQGPSLNQIAATVHFIEHFLVPFVVDRGFLPLDVTTHLFQGYCIVMDHCKNKKVLCPVDNHCIVILSFMIHWNSLQSVLPSQLMKQLPWSRLSLLLQAVNIFLTDGNLFPGGVEDSFCLAAAVFSALVKRGQKDLQPVTHLVQVLHNRDRKALAIMSDMLLASISVHQYIDTDLSLQNIEECWLLEIWTQFPYLISRTSTKENDTGDIRAKIIPTHLIPDTDITLLKCLKQLPGEKIVHERDVLLTAIKLFAHVCKRFEESMPETSQRQEIAVITEVSQSLKNLVRAAPLDILKCLPVDELKQCGLEIFHLYQQRLRIGT